MANGIKKTFLQLDRSTGKFIKKVHTEFVNTKEKMKGIGSGNARKPMHSMLLEKQEGNLINGYLVNATH